MTRLDESSVVAEEAVRSIPLGVRAASTRALTEWISHTRTPCNRPGADPEDWFPLGGEEPANDAELGWARSRARAVCRGCPVRLACLEQSLRDGPPEEQWGITGALCSADRRAVYRLWARLDDVREVGAGGAGREGGDDVAA